MRNCVDAGGICAIIGHNQNTTETTMKTTTEPSSRVLDCTTADETSGFVNAVIEQVGDDYGYYVQLDLHGEDIEGPFSSWEDALERAVEAEANGETSGNW